MLKLLILWIRIVNNLVPDGSRPSKLEATTNIKFYLPKKIFSNIKQKNLIITFTTFENSFNEQIRTVDERIDSIKVKK